MDTEPDAASLRAAGWVPAREAGDLLGVGPAQVGWLVRQDHLASETYAGDRRWVLRSEVEALVAERARWVSYADAAAMLGCSTTTVTALVHAGELERRGRGTNAVASLGRASVERVARERASAAAELEARRQARPPSAAPDDDHDWISPAGAAEVLGTTDKGVHWLIAHERVPAERRGARWWLRRDLVQLVANARRAASWRRTTPALDKPRGWPLTLEGPVVEHPKQHLDDAERSQDLLRGGGEADTLEATTDPGRT